jgi:putative hydrolase of the HAD superfamily
MKLTDFKVLTFDCYGTLIDWESGMVAGLQPLIAQAGREIGREEVLETHAFHESEQQRQTPAMPYRDLLPIVYKRIAEEWGVSVTWADCVAYGETVGDWPAFDDSAEALAYLKQHYKLVILSNVDNRSFAGSNRRLGVQFDAVYTAEDVGAYKPADANFDYMLSRLLRLGVQKRHILHVAESLFHDHVPANKRGLANCWIHRQHGRTSFGATRRPDTNPHFLFKFNTMAELAEAHKAALAG